MTALAVFVGAVFGAPLRYLADRAVQSRHDSAFPWGTLSVNVIGCLILGIVTGLGSALPGTLFALLGTGFCGALTTYSTFSYETLRLAEKRLLFQAVANIVASILAGFGSLIVAYQLTQSLVVG